VIVKTKPTKKPTRLATFHALLAPTEALTTVLVGGAQLYGKKPPGFGE
jgi:hypothetical protein